MMTSRRSRLKAVANLPARRKPLAIQQTAEDPKVQNDAHLELTAEIEDNGSEKNCLENVSDIAVETCDKGIGIGSTSTSPDAPTAEVSDSNECQLQSDRLTAKVPNSVENVVPKSNCKSNVSSSAGSRFGRRVKPVVSLAILKERPHKAEPEKTAITDGESIGKENQCISQDCNNSITSVNDNGKGSSEFEVKDISTESVSDLKVLETNKTVSDVEHCEKVSPGILCEERFDTNQSEKCSSADDVHQKNDEVTPQLMSSTAAINTSKKSVTVNNFLSNNKRVISKFSSDIPPQNNNQISDSLSNNIPLENNNQLQLCFLTNKKNSSAGKQKKIKFNEFTRKVSDARREFQRKYEKIPPDRSSLRMIDLIFYNPSTNPMESKSKLDRKELNLNDNELLNESKVDDPDPTDKPLDSTNDDEAAEDEYGKMPVPQVKIGSNGEIILDEKSLVIETTDAKKGREDLQNSIPVFEDRVSKTCYYKRKTQKSRDWSDTETKRFYKALNTIGTDFSLMQKYFPIRTRLELKNKFKREEKSNRNLIDKALNNPSEFDITQFEKYLATEKQAEDEELLAKMRSKIKIKKHEKKQRTKSSLLAREITESDEDVNIGDVSSNADIKSKEKGKQPVESHLPRENDSLQTRDGNQNKNIHGAYTEAAHPGGDASNNSSQSSKLLASNCINELNNAAKIKDAFDEIQNFDRRNLEPAGVSIPENSESGDSVGIQGKLGISGSDKDKDKDMVNEFYDAVLNLSASLKMDNSKSLKTNKMSKRTKRFNSHPSASEKRKSSTQSGRKYVKKQKSYSYVSTLDIETYDSKYGDSNSSSDESNDNSITSTRTITDQDFIKLLAANAKNMKESKIQLQITGDCASEKKVEIILDNVPSITLSEIEDQNTTTFAEYNVTIDESEPYVCATEMSRNIREIIHEQNDMYASQRQNTSVIVRNPNVVSKCGPKPVEDDGKQGKEFCDLSRLDLAEEQVDLSEIVRESPNETLITVQNGSLYNEKFINVAAPEEQVLGKDGNDQIIENENIILVIGENVDEISKNYQYMMVEEQ